MPAAMAPLETSSTSWPLSRSWAICRASSAMKSMASPAPLLVTSALPTLTTRRRAWLIFRLIVLHLAWRGSFAAILLVFDMLHDSESQLAAAVAADGGDGEMPLHRAVARDQRGEARLALVFRQQVDLVGDQPARLVVERRDRTSAVRRGWRGRRAPGRRRDRRGRCRRCAAADGCAAGGAETGGRGRRLRPRPRSGRECRRRRSCGRRPRAPRRGSDAGW